MNAKQCLLLLSGESPGPAAHLQDFISPVVKANPGALPSSVGKDLSGDIGPVLHVCVHELRVHICSARGVRTDQRKKLDGSFKGIFTCSRVFPSDSQSVFSETSK